MGYQQENKGSVVKISVLSRVSFTHAVKGTHMHVFLGDLGSPKNFNDAPRPPIITAFLRDVVMCSQDGSVLSDYSAGGDL